jgi:hypothetical protein
MFVELEVFIKEKEDYQQKINEINETTKDEEEIKKKITEEAEKYKGQVRKHLPSALNVIKNTFSIDYSIYKVGKDFNSEFKVVETNVRKTKPEVIAEMNEFKLKADGMNLSESDMNKLILAMDVFLTYSEDAEETIDENKEDYLSHAKITTSSIVVPTSRANNAFEPVNDELQHNPYANQPLVNSEVNPNPYANQPVVNTGFKDASYDNKALLVDPFASIYNGTAPTESALSAEPINQPIPVSQQVQPQIINENIMPSNQVETIAITPQPVNKLPNDIDFAIPTVNAGSMTAEVNKNIQPDFNNIGANQQTDTNKWQTEDQREEKTTLVVRIICGLLIPILSILAAIGYAKLVELPIYGSFFENLVKLTSAKIAAVVLYVSIGIVAIIVGAIIIKIAKSRTKHVGKFLILPSLITALFTLFSGKIFTLICDVFLKDDLKTLILGAAYLILSITFAVAVISLLYIKILLSKKDSSSRTKWNIMEKISFIGLIYVFFIPFLCAILVLVEASSIIENLLKIYNFNNYNNIVGGICAFLTVAVIIFNIKEDKKL